ncbi:MAG TPA: glycerophosphodiester phosphodiesterase family protein, partial [Vicinamibacterales bacterium]|nr:glycerophosphodiester phosphodiesterase family protein [Vicinamibacterales bacterium]
VATLSEVLARHRDVRVIVELKENRPELARAAVDAITRADATDRVCVGSFGLRVLRAVRTMAPSIATSAAREEVRWALYRSWCRWPVTRVAYRGYQIPEYAGTTRVVSPRFVADAHRAGLAVHVWTVNSEADATRLLGWDVDAVITDRPDMMIPVIRRR